MIMHINSRTTTGEVIRKVNYLIDLINALLGNTTPSTGVVTGGTTLDMSGIPGSVATIDLSSSAAIYIIANANNFDYIVLRPAPTYTPTFYDKDETSAISVIGSNMKLGNPIISINGTGKGQLVLQKRDNLWYQINIMDSYNV